MEIRYTGVQPPTIFHWYAFPLVWELSSHDASGLGRRVLHAYLTLFLHSQDASGLPVIDTETDLPQHNYNELCSTIINTYALGEHVGREWQLERVMRWTPARVSRTIGDPGRFT